MMDPIKTALLLLQQKSSNHRTFYFYSQSIIYIISISKHYQHKLVLLASNRVIYVLPSTSGETTHTRKHYSKNLITRKDYSKNLIYSKRLLEKSNLLEICVCTCGHQPAFLRRCKNPSSVNPPDFTNNPRLKSELFGRPF